MSCNVITISDGKSGIRLAIQCPGQRATAMVARLHVGVSEWVGVGLNRLPLEHAIKLKNTRFINIKEQSKVQAITDLLKIFIRTQE